MAKTEAKSDTKPTASRDVNGAQKPTKERKKLPPAQSYAVKRGFA